jgi:membrane-associated phospholipid phosphatase
VSLDARWYLDINEAARDSGWAHGVAAAYAVWAGLVAMVVLLVVGWLLARRRDDAPKAVATAFLCGASAVIALGINHFLSNAVARARPFVRFPHAETLISRAHDYSFPSDHCMIAGAFAAGLWLVDRRLGAIATVLAVALAFSRVYVGVHYPGDVAVGLLLGAAIALGICLGLRRVATGVAERLLSTPLRPLVTAAAPVSPEAPQ